MFYETHLQFVQIELIQLSYFYSLTRSISRWLKNVTSRIIVCTFTLKDFPTQTCAIKISLNILLNTPTICSN